jgi:HK97 family phage prohead protease
MERRMTPAGEVRVESRADGGKTLVGYGAVYHRADVPGSEYRLAPDIVERIAPGAFDRALKENQDVRGLYNHDPNMLLGRSAAGTMRLSSDKTGLRYEIDLPDTQVGRDVAASVARGDLTGSSFSFRINGKAGQRFEKANGYDVRHIVDCDLYDCGPVVFPAYSATSTAVRSADDCDDAIEARAQWRDEQEAVAVRLRMISLDNQTAVA